MSHAQQYLREVSAVANAIDAAAIEKLVVELAALRERGGRLFSGNGRERGELQSRGE